jgi:hypothetical protein
VEQDYAARRGGCVKERMKENAHINDQTHESVQYLMTKIGTLKKIEYSVIHNASASDLALLQWRYQSWQSE